VIDQAKIPRLISKFPFLIPTAKKLNGAGIDWLIGGSSCLFLLGNDRIPDDADIFLRDEEHDKADELFGIKSYIHTSPAGTVRNSNPENEHDIQLTSHIEFIFDKHYQFKITDLVNEHRIPFGHEGTSLYLLPPEDVLLIKALLQRGPSEGKQDIEDINNFRKIYQLDTEYLKRRITELGAENRVNHILL
jgi:predicted nucleotidyltransferase